MSKSFLKSGFVVLAALALASCAKTEEFKYNPDSALQIESVSGISPFALMQNPVSKAVITGESLPGDEAAKGIGLFVTAPDGGAYDGKTTGYTNVKYTFDGSKWSTQTPIYLSDNDGKLYGYFPYNVDATDLTAIPVQSSLNGTDYLYAEPQTVSHSEKNVSLQMNHVLSRLHLTIKKGANFKADALLSKITLKSTAIDASGTMDLTTGAITASKKSGETGTVELATDGAITADGIEKDILLVPADNSAGKKDITIILIIDNKSAGITLSGENGLDIRSGIQNNVILTIEDTGIKVTGVGVGVWGEGGSQQIQVGKHTVTVKLADDVVPHDILTEIYSDDSNVIINASSKSGNHLKCNLSESEYCPQDKTSNLVYTFTLSDIASDVTATIGYAKLFTISDVSSNNTDWGTASSSIIGECYEGEKISFTATVKGSGCKLAGWQDAGGHTLSKNNPYDVILASDLAVKAVFDAPAGALSVSSNGGTTTKQIHFSQGNLYFDGEHWGFEPEQYYFRTYCDGTNNGGKCDAGGYNKDSGTVKGHWGLFGWSTSNSKTTYGMSTSKIHTDYYGDFCDWGTAIDDKGTWRTLSIDEWTYLFMGRTNADEKYGSAMVCGVSGIVILPDSFTDPMKNKGDKAFVPKSKSSSILGYDENEYATGRDWEAMEAAGAVFLPSVGSREGTEVMDIAYSGYYWSSSQSHMEYDARPVSISLGVVHTDRSGNRCSGFAIRLVTDVE